MKSEGEATLTRNWEGKLMSRKYFNDVKITVTWLAEKTAMLTCTAI